MLVRGFRSALMLLGVAAILLLTIPAFAPAAALPVMTMDNCAHHLPMKPSSPESSAFCFACAVNGAPLPAEAGQPRPCLSGAALDLRPLRTSLRIGIDHAPQAPPPR